MLVDRAVPADSGTGVQFITLFTDEDDAEKLNETLAGACVRAGCFSWARTSVGSAMRCLPARRLLTPAAVCSADAKKVKQVFESALALQNPRVVKQLPPAAPAQQQPAGCRCVQRAVGARARCSARVASRASCC